MVSLLLVLAGTFVSTLTSWAYNLTARGPRTNKKAGMRIALSCIALMGYSAATMLFTAALIMYKP